MSELNRFQRTRLMPLFEALALTVVDVGARGGADEDFIAAAWASRMIGFEPEPAEARRLQERGDSRWREFRVLPLAIGKSTGPAALHVPRAEEGASLLPHNPDMIELFGYEDLHRVQRVVPVSTITLDDAAERFAFGSVDYLKLDIEGAELDVLRACPHTLESCVALKVECSFLMQRQSQCLAWELMQFLSDHAFVLADIIDIHRWRRRPVPADPYTTGYRMPYSRGVLSQCDLIALRRFDGLDESRALRLVLVSTLLGFFDFAVAVLRKAPSLAETVQARYGIDLESVLCVISKSVGRKTSWQRVRSTIRSLIPLVRSGLGVLPYRRDLLPY